MTQHVFDNSMVCHVWASQKQDSGRSHNGNVYFEGRTIFSYGSHFPMAHIMPDGVVLINDDSYSVSTSRHQRYVRQACHHMRQFYVPNLRELVYALNTSDDAWRAKSTRAYVESEALTLSDEAGAYLLKLAKMRNPERAFTAAKHRKQRERDKRAEREAMAAKKESLRVASRIAADDFDLRAWLQKLTGGSDWEMTRNISEAKTRLYHAHRAAKSAGRTRQTGLVWDALKAVRELDRRLESFRARKSLNRDLRTACRIFRGDVPTPAETTETHKAYTIARGASLIASSGRFLGGSAAAQSARVKFSRVAERYDARADELRAIAERERFERERQARADWLAGTGPRHWRGSDETGAALIRAIDIERDATGAIIAGTLQTSHGADVPLAHAIKAFRFVKQCRETKQAWHANGHTIRVGHFRIDEIDTQGNFTAGCHRIRWPEIERLARELDVLGLPPTDDALELSRGAA